MAEGLWARWARWWRGEGATDGVLDLERGSPVDEPAAGAVDAEFEPEPSPEEVVMEVGDVLDLHSFPPRDVKELVKDYLDHAYEQEWPQVRIIHGKGVGVQRRMVRSILEKDPRVVSFGDPPGESGGWGATWVRLKTTNEPSDGS